MGPRKHMVYSGKSMNILLKWMIFRGTPKFQDTSLNAWGKGGQNMMKTEEIISDRTELRWRYRFTAIIDHSESFFIVTILVLTNACTDLPHHDQPCHQHTVTIHHLLLLFPLVLPVPTSSNQLQPLGQHQWFPESSGRMSRSSQLVSPPPVNPWQESNVSNVGWRLGHLSLETMLFH